ncbi:signal peptidase II [Xenorhabdus sp. M]|uniref:Lipoprotein signal peptidase n=1 Tax=Xenorhabdus szentirmaii TaxID=290112 RepID=A0AAW3Z0J3_9GAMM|nr:signal peptidase II [Xenorhabdus sp. M]MBD2802559.1 signal peptidase II [Xenorhabdus sp. M]
MNKPICSTGLRWLWLVAVVLILDLGSKYLVLQNFSLYESIPLMPYFNLTYAQNLGAAFSFLADKGGWQRWFFALVATVITLVLMVMMYRSSARQKLSNIAYALVIGGALGNLFDRLVHGFVVDFIDFYVGEWHWPTFNIADSAICIGATLIIIESFIGPNDKQRDDNPLNDEQKAPKA